MHHKKVKTEPCLSPESPFVRKPSRQFLHKLSFNKNKQKQNEIVVRQQTLIHQKSEIPKISFIPTGINGNAIIPKNDSNKLKKTTIDLGTFKIKHENMTLKNELQEIKMQNIQLTRENEQLKKQNEQLKKQLQSYNLCTSQSKISKFSESTQENTDISDKNRFNNINYNSQKSQQILQINSYDLLPSTLKISKAISFNYEDQEPQDFNFLSTSLNRRFQQNRNLSNKILKIKSNPKKMEIQILQNKVLYLQKQLKEAIQRQRTLESQNQSLRLCASMSKRKLQDKDTQLKQIKIQERKKKYFQKLFELSSEQQYA